MRLLKNIHTGNVFGWTEILAQNPDLVEVRGVEADEPMEEVVIAKQKTAEKAEKAPEPEKSDSDVVAPEEAEEAPKAAAKKAGKKKAK